MGKTLAKRGLGLLLPLCLLALLLHSHPIPEALSGMQLHSPEADCPACATLQSGVSAPEPPLHLPLAPETVSRPPAPDTTFAFARQSGPISLRGPPPQA
jgi:hypothetical protein